MLKRLVDKIKGILAEQQRRMEEQIRIEKEKEAEAARIEREKIEAEKAELMKLSEKELMVETIIMLREQAKRIEKLEGVQEELLSRVN